MGKEHPPDRARKASTPWLAQSQVFADTRKVDLFNDPKWEIAPPPTRGREAPKDSSGVFGSAFSSLRRRLIRRGAHSRSLD